MAVSGQCIRKSISWRMCCLLFLSHENSPGSLPWWLHCGADPGHFREPWAWYVRSAVWGVMTVFPTRGHCGSRSSRGSQSVLQLRGLSEGQTFGVHLLGTNCVPLVSKRAMKRGQTQSPVESFPKVVPLYFSLRIKRGISTSVRNHFSPPQGWLLPAVNHKFGYVVLDLKNKTKL